MVRVATIIVTYRSAQLVIESLRSLQAERSTAGLDIRVMVVDNSSEDLAPIGRAIEANGWTSWVTLLQSPRNGGFAYGNNLGVERACADGIPNYFYLLNPDTQVRAGAVGALVRFLETHPEVAIAGSSFENVDGSEWPIAFRFPTWVSEVEQGIEFGLVTRALQRWVVPRTMTRAAQQVDWVSGASMMIRAAVYAELGGLDENYFLYFEEVDFCRRARQAGFPTWYVPESRVMHVKGHSTQLTDRPQRLPAYWFESRRRYFARSFGVHRAMLIDMLALLARSLGWLKRIALCRASTAVPYFIRDLAHHSIIWPRNRNVPEHRRTVYGHSADPTA
jgi:GT2 family glycosyltransferase